MKREDGSFIPPETSAKSREDNSWLDMPWRSQFIAQPRLAAVREKVSSCTPEREAVPSPHSTGNGHIPVPIGTNVTPKGEALGRDGKRGRTELK